MLERKIRRNHRSNYFYCPFIKKMTVGYSFFG
jgi:hypothetical protein